MPVETGGKMIQRAERRGVVCAAACITTIRS
jgi:hypothetical protein